MGVPNTGMQKNLTCYDGIQNSNSTFLAKMFVKEIVQKMHKDCKNNCVINCDRKFLKIVGKNLEITKKCAKNCAKDCKRFFLKIAQKNYAENTYLV